MDWGTPGTVLKVRKELVIAQIYDAQEGHPDTSTAHLWPERPGTQAPAGDFANYRSSAHDTGQAQPTVAHGDLARVPLTGMPFEGKALV